MLSDNYGSGVHEEVTGGERDEHVERQWGVNAESITFLNPLKLRPDFEMVLYDVSFDVSYQESKM
jgi:hypothetical protein